MKLYIWIIVSLILCAGAPQVFAADRGAALESAIASITVSELREHAGLLADDTLEGRAAGTRGGRAAARYIESKLRSAGVRPAGEGGGFLQRFSPGYFNVLAQIPGTDDKLKHEYVLVGAHYDHVGYGNRSNSNGPFGYIHNGADDNASGVSTLLELVDAFSRSGWQPKRSIIVAFWDGEEIDLLGSRHWVRQPTVPLASVRLAINVDMVGRMTRGRLEVSGTRTAAGLRQLFSSSRLPREVWIDFPWEYEPNSDHWPFYEASVPSLLIHTGVHEDYHRPSDDVEKLNINGMHATTVYLLDVLTRAADAEALPAFRTASRSESSWTRRQREVPLQPMAPRLGLRWDWQTADEQGVMTVESVTPGGAAERAGVRAGDRILSVDGTPVEVETLLPAAVLRAESEVTLEVARGDDEPTTLTVALRGKPSQLGIAWREDAGSPGSVYITRVVPYSPAARAGLRVFDRIYAVDGERFADQNALLEKVRLRLAEAESMQFELETAGRIRAVNVDLKLPTAPVKDVSL
ncbi:MAG TPA: M20/M25/M40 family metallo-hydrolase [Lacipirellula sp.]